MGKLHLAKKISFELSKSFLSPYTLLLICTAVTKRKKLEELILLDRTALYRRLPGQYSPNDERSDIQLESKTSVPFSAAKMKNQAFLRPSERPIILPDRIYYPERT